MKTIKNRNVNGRPKKRLSEKLKYRITVKFATEGFFDLKAKAREAGMNRCEYIRQAVKGSSVRQRLTAEQNRLILNLTAEGNNLNQIAKQANTTEMYSIKQDAEKVIKKLDSIINMIEK